MSLYLEQRQCSWYSTSLQARQPGVRIPTRAGDTVVTSTRLNSTYYCSSSFKYINFSGHLITKSNHFGPRRVQPVTSQFPSSHVTLHISLLQKLPPRLWEPTHPICEWVTPFFPAGKEAGVWDLPLASNLYRGLERVELYLCSLYIPS